MLLVTNNPLVARSKIKIPLEFLKEDHGQLLLKVKRYIIEEQMVLLTHPLSSSIKPNETYYKSIVLGGGGEAIDIISLDYIEQAIQVYQRFMADKPRPNWTEAVLQDFAYVDYYVMVSTVERMGIR